MAETAYTLPQPMLLAATRTDVVVAITGAAGGLVGLVLVFLGITVSSYQSLLGRISKEKVDAFKSTAWASLAVFLLGLVSVALSTAWLVADGGYAGYVATLVLFFAELGALIVLAVYSTSRALR
jgi:hypothetical protein